MTIITLSRQLGSGGDEIANRVAEALQLDLIDRARLRRAAMSAGVPEMAWEELELVGRGDLVDSLTKALRSVPPTPLEEREQMPILAAHTSPLDGIFAPPLPPASIALAESVRILEELVRRLAEAGNVIIIGSGAQVILADHPNALHVSVIAPFEQRVATVQQREGIPLAQARRKVRASDRSRAEYLRRFYRVRWDDPKLYHLTLNTGRLTRVAAAAIIVAAARELESS